MDNNALSWESTAPDVAMMQKELLEEMELKCIELRQDLVLSEMGDIQKKYYPSVPQLFIDFTCPGKTIGVYIIGHMDGKIADIGQGRVMSRIRLKRQFLVDNPPKMDSTKDYRVAEQIAKYDPDPEQWWAQYIPFYGLTAKDEARAYEEVLHQKYIMEENAPMFASLHMTGVG